MRRNLGKVKTNNEKTGRKFVMPGLVPGIHVLSFCEAIKTSMVGTSPAMTRHEGATG
jgi:hypothetical protein